MEQQQTMGMKMKQIKVKRDDFYEEEEEEEEPLSPYGSIFCNPWLDAYGFNVIGLKKPVHLPSMKTALQSLFSKHKRFSSIVRESQRGNRKWVRKEFNIEEHMEVVELSEEDRESADFVEKFTASLATASPLEPSNPLWKVYILNYRSAEAEASLVFRIHHCIGDGVSVMSLLSECTSQSSCSQPMPTIKKGKSNKKPLWTLTAILQKMWTLIFILWCNALSLLHAAATILWFKDSRMFRGHSIVASHPRRLVHVTVDLEDISIVRKAINGTVNDVVTGMLSAGLVRYFNRLRSKDGACSKTTRIRALVPVNIRSLPGIHTMEEMMKNGKKARWGNAFGMWILPIGAKQQQTYLEYCRQAKHQSALKKASFEAPFTHYFVDMLLRLFGWKASAAVTLRMLYNTTLVFSNVFGLSQQIQFHDNPVSHMLATVSGLPQGLVVHFLTYEGKSKLIAMASNSIFPNLDELCMDCAYALSQMKREAFLLNDNN